MSEEEIIEKINKYIDRSGLTTSYFLGFIAAVFIFGFISDVIIKVIPSLGEKNIISLFNIIGFIIIFIFVSLQINRFLKPMHSVTSILKEKPESIVWIYSKQITTFFFALIPIPTSRSVVLVLNDGTKYSFVTSNRNFEKKFYEYINKNFPNVEMGYTKSNISKFSNLTKKR